MVEAERATIELVEPRGGQIEGAGHRWRDSIDQAPRERKAQSHARRPRLGWWRRGVLGAHGARRRVGERPEDGTPRKMCYARATMSAKPPVTESAAGSGATPLERAASRWWAWRA